MIEGLQRKGRIVWVLRMPLAALGQERLSKKLLALHLAPSTEVYVKCTKDGELTLHGGHYSVFPTPKDVPHAT